MTTVNKSFTAVGVGPEVLIRHGQYFDYVLSGTFVGTLVIEKSSNGGQAWEQITSKTAAASGRLLIETPDQGHVNIRWRCTAYTSGTAVTSLSNVAQTLQEIKGAGGQTVAQVTEDGLSVTGALSVSGAVDLNAAITNDAGAGSAGHATITATEYGDGVTHKTVLTCVATPVVFADDTGVAQYGGVKVYDFPEGLINTLGCSIDGALTLPAPFIDTYDGDVALGTVTATTGATLTGTEADVLQSTPISQAVAKVAVCDAITIATALTESGGRHLDGTGTAKDLFLNFVIDDNAAHTAETGTFTGTITFMWSQQGDK